MPSLSQLRGRLFSTTEIREGKLNDIVNAIGSDHETVMNLGFALGLEKVAIDKHVSSNHKNGIVSPAGTRDMIFAWKRDTRPEEQTEKLREALIKAKLTEIADTYLPVNEETERGNLTSNFTTPVTLATEVVAPSSLTAQTETVRRNLRQIQRILTELETSATKTGESTTLNTHTETVERTRKRKLTTLKTSETQTVGPSTAKTGTVERNGKRKLTTLKTSETQTIGQSTAKTDSRPRLETSTTQTECVHAAESPELLCLKCDRVTAIITDVINTKISPLAVHSKVRNIKGKECLVQLMPGVYSKTKAFAGRHDVITLTTADVKLDDKVFSTSAFDGYKEHRATRCRGWYDIPADSKSAPFYSLWLQRLIHDEYDSDNELNVFYVKNRDKE